MRPRLRAAARLGCGDASRAAWRLSTAVERRVSFPACREPFTATGCEAVNAPCQICTGRATQERDLVPPAPQSRSPKNHRLRREGPAAVRAARARLPVLVTAANQLEEYDAAPARCNRGYACSWRVRASC